MSLAVASDAGADLVWLDDDGRRHDQPEGDPGWCGIAVQAGRCLCWSRARVVAETHGGPVEVPVEGHVERAIWAGPSTVDVDHHDTTGHPTDRGGYRTRIRLPDGARECIAWRQGVAPPVGASGLFTRHDDVASSPAGRLLSSPAGPTPYRWAPHGSRQRWKVPGLTGGDRFDLVSIGRTHVVAASTGCTVRLFTLERGGSRRPPVVWDAPARVRQVIAHGPTLVAAVDGHAPIALDATRLPPPR